MLPIIQFYVFEIIFLEGSGDLKSLHDHHLHVSQTHHSTQPESKKKILKQAAL